MHSYLIIIVVYKTNIKASKKYPCYYPASKYDFQMGFIVDNFAETNQQNNISTIT